MSGLNGVNMSETECPFISIIILNWNGKFYLERCIRSVLQSEYPENRFELIIVDNASSDGSVEIAESLFPDIKFIKNKKNMGFCKGNNIGIKHSKGDLIILLNNDTLVEREWLNKIVNVAKSPKVGIIGCRIYYPSDAMIQTFGFRLKYLCRWEAIGAGEFDKGQYDQINGVDFVSGAAITLKRCMLNRIGLLDSQFGSIVEDADICYRAKEAGFNVVVSKARVYHYGSVSWNNFLAKKIFYQKRNEIIFVIKHFPASLFKVVLLPFIGLISDFKRYLQVKTVLQKRTKFKSKNPSLVKFTIMSTYIFYVSLLILTVTHKKRFSNIL